MTNKNKTNDCYVFSDKTLELAKKDWKDHAIKENPQQEEILSIAITALPWLLAHMNQQGPIFMFTVDDLLLEKTHWKNTQIEAFPHQRDRIEKCCELLNDFFQSEIVTQTYKMKVKY